MRRPGARRRRIAPPGGRRGPGKRAARRRAAAGRPRNRAARAAARGRVAAPHRAARSAGARAPGADTGAPAAGLIRGAESISGKVVTQGFPQTSSRTLAMAQSAGLHEDSGSLKPATIDRHRSEEHTSELQSRENLVCRLLLEKKKERLFALSW